MTATVGALRELVNTLPTLQGMVDRLQFLVGALQSEQAVQGRSLKESATSSALAMPSGMSRGTTGEIVAPRTGGKTAFVRALEEINAKVQPLTMKDIVLTQRIAFFDTLQSILDVYPELSEAEKVVLLSKKLAGSLLEAAHISTPLPSTVAAFRARIEEYFTFNAKDFYQLTNAGTFKPRAGETPHKWLVRLYNDAFTQCRGVPPVKDIREWAQ